MLSEPIFQMRKLNCTRFHQSSGSEFPDPVVMDIERCSNFTMLPHSPPNLFPGLLNALFYRHDA